MTPRDLSRPASMPPPSFTPQSGRPPRPSERDATIEVGNIGDGALRATPATGAPKRAAPVVRRTSSDAVAGQLSSNAPRPGSSGRIPQAAPRAATPPPARPGGPGDAGHSAAASRPGGPTGPPRPGGPTGPPRPGGSTGSERPGGSSGPRRTKPRWGRIASLSVALLLVPAIAWPVGLLVWANGSINHLDALSGAADTPGTTYLLAGSDARTDGAVEEDGTEGARTDTIMVLHVPDSGPTSLISLPRDSYVNIPGHKANKLNAAYSWGGAPLLVETVEGLTGLSIDHYVEIGFSGVETIVDAVDGVELCLDYDVDDPKSGLVWTAGCHLADGSTALAFSRMRYSDPRGDIGRAERQRQVIAAVSSALQDTSILVKPGTQKQLISSGLDVLTVDEGTNIIGLAKMALAFRAANGAGGVTGTPPLGSLDYRPGGVGSAVELDAERGPQFWIDIADGTMPAGVTGGLPQ